MDRINNTFIVVVCAAFTFAAGIFFSYFPIGCVVIILVLLSVIIYLAEKNRRQARLIKYITGEYKKVYAQLQQIEQGKKL